MRGDHFLLILVLYFSTFLITCIHTQSIPTSEYIFILKSPSDDYDLTLEDYLNEQIQQFHTLLPTANILHIYSNFLQFGFISFTAKCNKNDLHHLENQFLNLKFYEESSYLTISRSLVKTVPFVSQYLRSETPTMQKSGFCTFSYEAYDQFLNDRGQYMDSPPDIYIIDTGIQSSHDSFRDRVVHGFDSLSIPPLKSDPNGHGTQVAGIIGGEFYGLMNTATLIDVRVANENGIARIHDIISGMDYILGRYLSEVEQKGRLSALASMSLSGTLSKALKYAIYSFSKVLLLVAPAGDHDSFSCSYSPANSPFVIITAATIRDLDLERAESNYGDCIDIWAPGDMILSPYIGQSNSEESYLSGSSASTAVVAGLLGVVIGVIRSHPPVDYEGKMLNLYDFFVHNLEPANLPILLRNILLSSSLQFPSASPRESHPSSVIYCDLRTIDSIIWAAKDYYRKLIATEKNSPISRVKSNFLQHQRNKLNSIYE